MKYLQLVKSLCLTGLLFLATSAWASVAYILTLNGQPSDFELIRNSRSEPVTVNKSLEVNDKIQVKVKRSASLTLLLGNGELLPLTYQDTHPTPYQVKESQAVSGEFKGVMNSLQAWFSSLQEHHVHLVSVYTRSTSNNPEPLSMPLLAGDPTLLLAGKTTLSLGWQGGQAMYQVQIIRQGSNQIWKKPGLPVTSVTFNNLQLIPGHYLVEVSDAKGQSVKGNFQVVANSTILHKQAQAIQNLSLSEDNRKTWLASWLAQQPEWRLEAYQQVAGIAKRFEPALLVKEGLEGGIISK